MFNKIQNNFIDFNFLKILNQMKLVFVEYNFLKQIFFILIKINLCLYLSNC